MINNDLCKDVCPRCGGCEDWEHAICCDGINEEKYEYLKELNQNY